MNYSATNPPPRDLNAWNALRLCSEEELIAMGFGRWNREVPTLMLIPYRWHANIPDGLKLECIFGKIYTAGEDDIDDDYRGGCLAYGFRV